MIIRNVLRSGLSEHHLVAISLFDVRCPTSTLLRKNLNGGKVKHIPFYKAYYRHFNKGYKNKKNHSYKRYIYIFILLQSSYCHIPLGNIYISKSLHT